MVLLGDAAHTAHFSIGSGTKLAMEDSIALAGRSASTAIWRPPWPRTRPSGVLKFETLQRAAQTSLEWFERPSATTAVSSRSSSPSAC